MIYKRSQVILSFLSVILVIFLAVIIFSIFDMRGKNIETSKLLNESSQIVETDNITQSIKVIRSSSIEDINAFNDLVLVDDKLVSLIESIENKGKELGLTLNIVSVEKRSGAESNTPNTIRMAIEADGTWVGTYAFLRAIESLPHRVMIDEMSFSKTSDDWHLRVVLILSSFD